MIRAKVIDVTANIRDRTIVMRSRFFSMTPVPPKALGAPPPKALDNPVPRPEWSKMAAIRPRLTSV
jgi:hypothetical protein